MKISSCKSVYVGVVKLSSLFWGFPTAEVFLLSPYICLCHVENFDSGSRRIRNFMDAIKRCTCSLLFGLVLKVLTLCCIPKIFLSVIEAVTIFVIHLQIFGAISYDSMHENPALASCVKSLTTWRFISEPIELRNKFKIVFIDNCVTSLSEWDVAI